MITENTMIESPNDVIEEFEEPNSVPKLSKSPSSSFLFMRSPDNIFKIHSIKPDGTQITLSLDAGSCDTKNSWIEAIKVSPSHLFYLVTLPSRMKLKMQRKMLTLLLDIIKTATLLFGYLRTLHKILQVCAHF